MNTWNWYRQQLDKVWRMLTAPSKGTPMAEDGTYYASFQRRLFASTLDSLVMLILLVPVFQAILPGNMEQMTALQAQIAQTTTFEEQRALAAKFWGSYLTGMFFQTVIILALTFWCWVRFATTPGKWIMRMRIVDANTLLPLSRKQAWKRTLGYLVSSAVFFLGFFWIGLDKRKQGWHDKMANTVVIVLP